MSLKIRIIICTAAGTAQVLAQLDILKSDLPSAIRRQVNFNGVPSLTHHAVQVINTLDILESFEVNPIIT